MWVSQNPRHIVMGISNESGVLSQHAEQSVSNLCKGQFLSVKLRSLEQCRETHTENTMDGPQLTALIYGYSTVFSSIFRGLLR